MELQEILPKLTAWFPPEDHKERKLPGGGRWFYIPHQSITRHLNEVCPGDWHTKISSTNIAGDYRVVFLELTICSVTRTGIGDDKTFPETNDEGKAKIIGTPPVRAFRNAFKDACEQFGICAYLDEQSLNRNAFIKFMQSKGDVRAYKYAQENEWKEAGAMGTPKQNTNKPAFSVKPPEIKKGDTSFIDAIDGNLRSAHASEILITANQAKRLWAIAKTELKLTDEQIKSAQTHFGFAKTELISQDKYESLINYLRTAVAETATVAQDLYPENNNIVRQV